MERALGTLRPDFADFTLPMYAPSGVDLIQNYNRYGVPSLVSVEGKSAGIQRVRLLRTRKIQPAILSTGPREHLLHLLNVGGYFSPESTLDAVLSG